MYKRQCFNEVTVFLNWRRIFLLSMVIHQVNRFLMWVLLICSILDSSGERLWTSSTASPACSYPSNVPSSPSSRGPPGCAGELPNDHPILPPARACLLRSMPRIDHTHCGRNNAGAGGKIVRPLRKFLFWTADDKRRRLSTYRRRI